MKTLLFAILGTLCLIAQPAASPLAGQMKDLAVLNDQVRLALSSGDLDKAQRYSSDLLSRIVKLRTLSYLSPAEKLAKLELSLPAQGLPRFYALAELAKTAFDARELAKADLYARELLAGSFQYPKDWNSGNATFLGNSIIGRIALTRDSNLPQAKIHLLASVQTTGSPQLNSFGPNMSLARALIEAGERDTVLEFFAQCRKFWKMGGPKLDQWTAMVKGGGTPDFGANLLY